MNEIKHIGDLIKQQLKKQDRSVAWLARQLNCDPSNLRKKLQHPDVHLNVIRRISIFLGHNFFLDCSALLHKPDETPKS